MTVRDVFTFAWLLEEAGDRPLAGGVAYAREGRVSISRDVPDRVDAIVQGTEPYVVELLLEGGLTPTSAADVSTPVARPWRRLTCGPGASV